MADNPFEEQVESIREQIRRAQFSPENRMLQEIRQANDYLETLIGLFLKAFPDLATDEVNQELEQSKKKRIGFPIGESEK